MKGPAMLRKKQVHDQMLAYVGLTSAEAILMVGDDEVPDGPNCRVTLVPGRLLVAPTRSARHHGLEGQEYGWPAIAMIETENRFSDDTTTLLVDVSGQLAHLHVTLEPADLRWALTECGFQVIAVPHAPCARPWVPEELWPLLPVSLFV